ncbi:MAG: HAD family hydrolase [Spirochaetales bacterium]|nr:HAD family hydrolase [Spirochaetales bacterium]
MALASDLSPSLMDELKRAIAERGVVIYDDYDFVPVAQVPSSLEPLLGKELPVRPLAVAVDVYGTLLASAVGEIGPVADWDGPNEPSTETVATMGTAFPHDLAERLRRIVAADHAKEREHGIPWPEVDSPSVFARALDLEAEDGARACVAWECAMNPCSAMPGAAGFLACCADRGMPLGIVSNAQFYTPLFIEAAFGTTLFGVPGLGIDPELALWSWETGRAKPDSWMFAELARRLALRGVPVNRILYVGNDARNDCAAAGEVGMMTALFCGDARSFKPRLDDSAALAMPPTVLVQSWDDLRRIVCT